MSYVEGIGDEVMISVAIVFIIMISLLLWSLIESNDTTGSTTYRNSQNFSVEETSSEQRDLNANNTTDNQSAQAHTATQNEALPELREAESVTETTTEGNIENPNTETECEDSHVDIRQRRLDFFKKENVHDLRSNCVNTLTNGSVSGVARGTQPEEGEPSSNRSSEHIQIRLKYLDDTERTVLTLPLQTIQEFKRAHFAEELANNKLVRLISTGYVLEDTRTLQSYGLVDSSVVHVQIQTSQANPRRQSNDAESELDIGQFLSPILGVALLCVWIMHFQYKEYFTTTATVALLILSGLFLTVVWGQHGSRTLNATVQ